MMRQKKERLRMTIPVMWRSVQRGSANSAVAGVKFFQHFRFLFSTQNLIIKTN